MAVWAGSDRERERGAVQLENVGTTIEFPDRHNPRKIGVGLATVAPFRPGRGDLEGDSGVRQKAGPVPGQLMTVSRKLANDADVHLDRKRLLHQDFCQTSIDSNRWQGLRPRHRLRRGLGLAVYRQTPCRCHRSGRGPRADAGRYQVAGRGGRCGLADPAHGAGRGCDGGRCGSRRARFHPTLGPTICGRIAGHRVGPVFRAESACGLARRAAGIFGCFQRISLRWDEASAPLERTSALGVVPEPTTRGRRK